MQKFFQILVLALILLSAGCAVLPVGEEERHPLVLEYYQSVLEDRVKMTPSTLERKLGGGAIVEPIGWTVSGRIFGNVISGDWDSGTARVLAAPLSQAKFPHREGTFPVEIFIIHEPDLPEYFNWRGLTRAGWSSVTGDRVFLDARRGYDTKVLTEAYHHEVMHLMDRRLIRVLPLESLESRAMIHGLAQGDIGATNLRRIRAASKSNQEHYAASSRTVMNALQLVLGTDTDLFEADAPEAELKSVARALETLMGINVRSEGEEEVIGRGGENLNFND